MGRNHFENPSSNVAFERCIDVLAELIEKYAGKFTMDDIGNVITIKTRDEIRKEHVPKSKLTVTQCRITMVSESEVAQDEDYNS